MSGAQKTDFQTYFPTISDAEAAASLTNPGEIVSVTGRRAAPNVFLVKFSTRTGVVGPLVLNRYTAEILKQTLDQQGF
jgi:hypothetical protein